MARFVAFFVLACMPVYALESIPEPDTMFVRGDTNNDNAWSLPDVMVILEDLFQSAAKITCEDAADVNDDGEYDVADAVSLLIYLFAGGSSPVSHEGRFGHDFTQDGLGCVSYRDMPQITVSMVSPWTQVTEPGVNICAGEFVLQNENASSVSRIDINIQAMLHSDREIKLTNFSLVEKMGDDRVVLAEKIHPQWNGSGRSLDKFFRYGLVAFENLSCIPGAGKTYAIFCDIGEDFADDEAISVLLNPFNVYSPEALVGPDIAYSSLHTIVSEPIRIRPMSQSKTQGITRCYGVFLGGFSIQSNFNARIQALDVKLRQSNPNAFGGPMEVITNVRLIWNPDGEFVILDEHPQFSRVLGSDEAVAFFSFNGKFDVLRGKSVEVFVFMDTGEIPFYVPTGQIIDATIHNFNIADIETAEVISLPTEIALEPTVIYAANPIVRQNKWLEDDRARNGFLESGNEKALYAFEIMANGLPVGLYKVAFRIEASYGISVSNPRIYDSETNIAIPGIMDSENCGLETCCRDYSFAFNANDGTPMPCILSENTKRIFRLVADINIFGVDYFSRAMTVQMKGDVNRASVFPAPAQNITGNFVWSDLNFSPLPYSSMLESAQWDQWTNGWYISGINFDLSSPVIFITE